MTVEVLLPGAPADPAGGRRRLSVDPATGTVAGLLDAPAGADVRFAAGVHTAVGDGAVVQVLPSVAGG